LQFLCQPQSTKAAKEAQKNAKFKKCVLHAQAKAIADIWQQP
jgi:hypothetical protein